MKEMWWNIYWTKTNLLDFGKKYDKTYKVHLSPIIMFFWATCNYYLLQEKVITKNNVIATRPKNWRRRKNMFEGGGIFFAVVLNHQHQMDKFNLEFCVLSNFFHGNCFAVQKSPGVTKLTVLRPFVHLAKSI